MTRLIESKIQDLAGITGPMTDMVIRLREEVSEQIKALKEMIEMGKSYGLDLSRPAENAQEAVQWTYMAYLAAVKEQDGAAMSLGNVSSFLDIYIENDLEEGLITEVEAQEYIDQFVMKLRMVRHLRMEAYDEIFAGDPTWVTEAIGGMLSDGRSKVTKTSFRFLNTLYNLGASPEPNITILWSEALPQNFKDYCAKVAIDTTFENEISLFKIDPLVIESNLSIVAVVGDKMKSHQGISGKMFKRTFSLGEFIEVKKVWFENGLLSIELEKVIPEDKQPKVFDIK